MAWKIAAVWLVVGAVILLILLPGAKVSVRLDLPPASQSGAAAPTPTSAQIDTAATYLVGISTALVIACPLAAGAWLTRRIVTRTQARKDAAKSS